MANAELQEIKNQANFLLEAGRGEEAVTMLTRGLSMAPQDDEVLCLMSQAFVELNKWRDARRFAERAIAAAPENDWGHRLHSIALRNSSFRYDAVAAAREAVRLNPMVPHNWHTLASSQLNVLYLKEARESAAQLRSLAPSWHMSHQILALVALKEGKNEEAEFHCRRELALNPDSYYGMNNLGVALLNQKRKREAIDVFTRAAKLNPAAPIARDNIATAVTKYLPRISIPFFAIYVVLNGLRVIGDNGGAGWVIFVIALIAVLIGVGIFVRRYRYRSLPTEVREYLRSAKTQVPANRGPTARQWWLAAIVACSMVLIVWLGVAWIDLNLNLEYPGVAGLSFLLVVLLALTGAVIAFRRAAPKRDG